MEGPTPVSALIHAATMVTAGVYLIARMHPLFELAPAAGDVGAIIGAVTLLVAGTIGLVATDLKRVIAYSTMSQIGYMIMGVSVGAYTAGLFHLMTHAFFKALLFMAAGSMIGAMGGDQSLDRMSGFRRALPFTFVCFVIGGLALSGIPPFSRLLLQGRDPAVRRRAAAAGTGRCTSPGYVGALLTARLHVPDDLPRVPRRALPGGAWSCEHGHLYHPEQPTNPANGEVEDTDVGFPGPEHEIAERSLPMRVAMGDARAAGDRRRHRRDPEDRRAGSTSFLAPTLRGLDARQPPLRTALLAFGLDPRRGRRPRRDRDRLRTSGSRGRRSRRTIAARFRGRSTRSSSTSGTSTS